MKKINTLNVKQLRTEECFGYLKQVLAETSNLPSEETPAAQTTAVNAFETAFDAFDTALKASAVNPATASATNADVERDQSWRGINAYVKAMCNHPTADIAATAAEAAYRSLVDTVNALAMINGDAAYATFIDHVNAMIERQKAISKARSTRAKKDDEEKPSL